MAQTVCQLLPPLPATSYSQPVTRHFVMPSPSFHFPTFHRSPLTQMGICEHI